VAPRGASTTIALTTGDAAAVHADLQTRGVDVDELLRWPGVPPTVSRGEGVSTKVSTVASGERACQRAWGPWGEPAAPRPVA